MSTEDSDYQKQYYQKNREEKLAYHREYYKKNRKRCRAQQAEYRKKHWAREVARNCQYVKKRQEEIRSIIRAYKEQTPCTDCGKSFPFYMLDLDHVRGEKTGNFANSSQWCRTLEKLVEELENCDVVCANCHRIRTYARGQHWNSHNKRPSKWLSTPWNEIEKEGIIQ